MRDYMRTKLFLTGLLLTLFLTPAVVHGAENYIDWFENTGHAQVADGDFMEPVIFMTTAALNLRPEPSTDNTRLALVQPGTRVEVVNFRWSMVCGNL